MTKKASTRAENRWNARTENSTIKSRTHWNPIQSLRNWWSNIKFRNKASSSTAASNEITAQETHSNNVTHPTDPVITRRQIERTQQLEQQAAKYPPQTQRTIRAWWSEAGADTNVEHLIIHPDDQDFVDERTKEDSRLDELLALKSSGNASEDDLDEIALLQLKHENTPYGISIAERHKPVIA